VPDLGEAAAREGRKHFLAIVNQPFSTLLLRKANHPAPGSQVLCDLLSVRAIFIGGKSLGAKAVACKVFDTFVDFTAAGILRQPGQRGQVFFSHLFARKSR
jgi:hypothetical protein